MENDLSVQEGVFYTYINPSKGEKAQYMEKEYDTQQLLPSLNMLNINTVMKSTEKIVFIGITTDQQLYRPHKDVKILISALNYPNAIAKITIRREGAFWLSDTINLSSAGLGIYTLLDADIGKYDVTGEVLTDNTVASIGTASFDVAVFELAPFQVIIKQQTMSKEQRLSANVMVSIFHQPYSGQLKIGLYCSYCRSVVLRDEITCIKGEGIVSFDVSGHTAPFSLEFIAPDRGYTAMIQLEGTMPHQRILTPISSNLEQNYQMSLFPQTGSIAVQGINITPSERTKEAKFKVDHIVMDEINIEITENINYMGITVYDPITQQISYQEYTKVKKGTIKKVSTSQSHIIVFLACVENDRLFEAFFVGFRSLNTLPQLNVPDHVEAGTPLSLEINNSANDKSEIFLIIFDKRKTHSSLYKAVGEHIHEHLKQGLTDLPTQLFLNQQLREKKEHPSKEDENAFNDELVSMEPVLELKKSKFVSSAPKPPLMDAKMGGGMATAAFGYALSPPSPVALSPPPPPPSLVSSISMERYGIEGHGLTEQALIEDIFEEFEDVLYCETFVVDKDVQKTITVDLADQITTWEVRMYSFQGLLFQEIIKDIKATKARYIQIRAPEVIDTENGDSAEIEIHYLSDMKGTLEVFLDDKQLIAPSIVEATEGKITTTLTRHGMVRAILKTPQSQIEGDKEIHLTFPFC